MTYLILDTQNKALANGELASPPGTSPMRLNILDHKVDSVMEHEVVTLFSASSEELPIQCRILRQRGDAVLLEKIATLDPEVRRNLRVPVKFDTFLYALPSSSWVRPAALRKRAMLSPSVLFSIDWPPCSVCWGNYSKSRVCVQGMGFWEKTNKDRFYKFALI